MTVVGANPQRDAYQPRLGGPCSPHALGTTTVMLEWHVDDVDSVVNKAIAAGAFLRQPVEDTPAGDRVGVVIDPFGHIWVLIRTSGNKSSSISLWDFSPDGE